MTSLDLKFGSSQPTITYGDTLSAQAHTTIVVIADNEGPKVLENASISESTATAISASLSAFPKACSSLTVTTIPSPQGLDSALLVTAGIGNAGEDSIAAAVSNSVANAARSAATHQQCEQLAIVVPTGHTYSTVLGALLGLQKIDKISSSSSTANIPHIEFVGAHANEAARAEKVANGVILARSLVNTPPNLLFPESFAAVCSEVAKDLNLEVEILDDTQLIDQGFGGISGVGQGSSRGPRLVRLTHKPAGATGTPKVALVGKGVTFDTGGISIKPAAGMEKMTMDMGGAAAVVGTIATIAALEVDTHVVAYIPMAENMPSATAYRPGDVLTMYGGKTVEVLNTDAEGRLLLADALVKACEEQPEYVIDVATLTGAQMVALGNHTPGIMGTDALRDELWKISEQVDDNGWPMPLPSSLRSGLDSATADLANVSNGRWGGMLTAGLFLREFVSEGIQWAHIDIAGPAYNDGGPDGIRSKGGTGVPVRSLVKFIETVK